VIEALAYAVARGFLRAYLDFLAEQEKAVEEAPSDRDRLRARRFADAIRLHQGAVSPTGSDDSASAR